MRLEKSNLYKVVALVNGVRQIAYFVADDMAQLRNNIKLTPITTWRDVLSIESIRRVNSFIEGGQ